jgi:hypothetical protein
LEHKKDINRQKEPENMEKTRKKQEYTNKIPPRMVFCAKNIDFDP